MDAFETWLRNELKYRKDKLEQAEQDGLERDSIWYEAQIGMLEIVIKQLPFIGQPHKEVTDEDIWQQAEEAYKKHTI